MSSVLDPRLDHGVAREVHRRSDCEPAAEPPLSPEQSGLWYLQQLVPECGAYHLLFAIDVECLGVDLPRRANEALIAMTAAHDVLRTVLPATPLGPVQRVLADAMPEIRMSDAIGRPVESLRERARLDSRLPFDLELGPLWRVQAYRRDASRWLVVVVAHHVILDFWSLGLLLQEMAGRLDITGQPTQFPDGCAYAAHAVRQQSRLADSQRSAGWIGYWTHQLRGAPVVHGLSLDAPRAAVQSHDGATLPFSFDKPTSESIRRVGKAFGVTPFMVLLAAYSVLLQRFSGEDDLIVASPVAGRTERAQRRQLGQFVNTVALRLQPDLNAGFGDVLHRVRDTVVEALRHADAPFHRLVQELAPQRDPSHAPIAQIGFSWERLPLLADFENYLLPDPPTEVRTVPGARLRPFFVPQQEGQFELMLEMGGELDGAFVGAFKFQPHLFRRETIATMAECFVHLTRRLAASPTTPLAEIGLDDAHATARARALGRGEDRHWPEGSLISQIAAHAQCTPRAIAVSDAKQTLDYAALWNRASSIGAALQAIGVGPGARVGLMLSRGVDLVGGMLGIWLTGGAYVPLDPDFPPERLAHIADDAGLTALFTEHSAQSLWPVGLPVLCADAPMPDAAALGPVDRGVDTSAENETEAETQAATNLVTDTDAAYILYTSGSTGRPKGVRVGHASVRNFLLSLRDLLQWNASTCLLSVTTPAFDISVLETMLPLLVGGEVRIADAESTRDGRLLAQWLAAPADRPVTAMQATPATWRMLIDAGWAGQPGLTALCGGEPMPPLLAEQLHARVEALWNLYGPTEATVWSSVARLQPGDPIHLGLPIFNTRYHVLDERGRAVPPGVPGELWIGGDGLALDYWRQPDLTAERFSEVPTVPDDGRLYRTGDRVRWNADGRLEHRGRLDFQVKLRGFRIELGEIESVLRRMPGIADAAVVLREDVSTDPRLVAYIEAAEMPPRVEAIRSALRSVLPTYMVPPAFVFLEALPLTPNRKVDRKALMAIAPASTSTSTTSTPSDAVGGPMFIAPRDAVEIRLAGLFANLLGIECVGVDESFFDLGGHSLLAVRLVAAIQRDFGVELAVAELIQHSSVAALAVRLRRGESEPPGPLVILRPGQDRQPLWLFHPIGGNVFCYVEVTRRLSPLRPVIAVQSPGLVAAGEAEVSIEAMAQRYLALLREVQPQGPYLLGGWCFGGNVAYEAARQLRDAGQQVSAVVLIDTRAPIAANIPSDADDATLLSWFARDLATPYGKVLSIEADRLRALPEASMFDHVLDRAKAIGVLPEDADADQLARYFEVYLANGMALRAYAPPSERSSISISTPTTIPIRLLLLRAIDEPPDHGPLLGWDELASLDSHDVPGDHNTVMHAPNAAVVAACVDDCFPVLALPGFTT